MLLHLVPHVVFAKGPVASYPILSTRSELTGSCGKVYNEGWQPLSLRLLFCMGGGEEGFFQLYENRLSPLRGQPQVLGI